VGAFTVVGHAELGQELDVIGEEASFGDPGIPGEPHHPDLRPLDTSALGVHCCGRPHGALPIYRCGLPRRSWNIPSEYRTTSIPVNAYVERKVIEIGAHDRRTGARTAP
jgi:hypothetical protein